MSVDAINTTVPAVSEFAPQVSSAGSPTTPELGAPTDPFAILLAAASSSPAESSSPPSLGNAVDSTPIDQQLVALENAPSTSSTFSPGASDLTSSGSAVVAEAAQYVGVPYEWGGSTPSGFDCSGLTQYVFGQLGVDLPRTAAEQEQVGTPITSLAEAQPGDLLFFEPGQNGAPPGEAGHVAIYIGNDQMIAAPQTGEDVQVQQVPGQPLAIRRITVPTSTNPLPIDPDLAGDSTSVQMGNVAVPSQYAGMIEQASTSSGTPAALLAAILNNESSFEPTALSGSGAEGIAQFMPSTAAANGVDPFDPTSAITGAANLLAQYHAAFGSWTDAVAAYTAGGGAVEQAGGIPNDGSTPSYVADALSLAGMAPSS